MSGFTDLLDSLGVKCHWALDEASGTVAVDRKGYANGVYAGTGATHPPPLTLGTGAGKSFATHGTAYVSATDPGTGLQPNGGSYAAGCFITLESLPTTADAYWFIFRKENNGPFLSVDPNGTLYISWFDLGALKQLYVMNALAAGPLYMVGFDVNAATGTTRLFINGELVATDALRIDASIYSTFDTLWGAHFLTTAQNIFKGTIDEAWVKVGTPPTEAQWAQLYDLAYFPPYIPVTWTPNRHMFMAIGSHADLGDPATVAARHSAVVMQHWRTAERDAIKAANPACRCYGYQNLTHITEGSTNGQSSSAISAEAATEALYGHDAAGHRVANPSYPYIFYNDPGDATFVSTVVSQVTTRLAGWDGVFFDDVNSKPASIAEGTLVEFPTNTDYYKAVTKALAGIYPAMKSAGFKMCANIGAWHAIRDLAEPWLVNLDAALVENGLRYTGNGVFAYDGSVDSVVLLSQRTQKFNVEPWINLPTNPPEHEVALYAMAILMIVTDGRAQLLTPQLPVNYDFYTWDAGAFDVSAFGNPLGPAVILPSGVYQRDFQHGKVYMSGLDVETDIALPPGFTLSSGINLPAKSAAFVLADGILHVAAPEHIAAGGNWYAHTTVSL